MTNEPEVHHAQELRCQELIELITDYLDATMIPADQMCFEQHLARCEGCSHYLAEIRKTIKVGGALGKEWITPAAKAQLLSVFRNWKRESRTQREGGR